MEHMLEPEKKWKHRYRFGLLFIVLAVLLANAFFFLKPDLSASLKPEEKKASMSRPPTMVETVEVTVAPSSSEIMTIGTLEAKESVIIRSEVIGRISAIDFNEGEAVAQNTVLFSLDQSVLQAELEKAEADLELHRADYKRTESLLKDKAISERERDQAYALWKLDQANVRLIQAKMDKTLIRAPFDGILGLRKVSLGDFINAGQDLINLEDISRLKVAFKIPEIHSAQVRKGQKVLLRADAFPDEKFEAEVYAVNPRIDSQGRSIEVRALMENQSLKLHPGQFVRVALEVDQRESAIFVPEQALVPQPERIFVWKVADGRSVMTEVSIGKRIRGQVEISKGLNPGDTVVTGGIQKLAEGMAVKAVPADPEMFRVKS